MKILLSILFFFLLTMPAVGQWSSDPTVNTPVCTAPNGQGMTNHQAITTDGAGGAIVVWEDERNGTDADIYAQRIDRDGMVRWTIDGIAICKELEDQTAPSVMSDGAGGAIIAWLDKRNGSSIFAQRVNSVGEIQWEYNGTVICTAALDRGTPRIASDDSGGAIIVWKDTRNGIGNSDLYAQRINDSGVVQWALEGIVICDKPNDQLFSAIVRDGSGGAVIAWQDNRNGTDFDIYCQRVTRGGSLLWASNGEPICTASGDQTLPILASDGFGGAIVTWHDLRNGIDYDVYAQRINGAGTVQWMANGIAVAAGSGSQEFPTIAEDGAGGALIAWNMTFDGIESDLFAQRVSSGGVLQWRVDGVPICTARHSQAKPQMINDGSGGAIITWWDGRNFNTLPYDSVAVYAQRINGSGIVQWDSNGIAISTAVKFGANDFPVSVGDGSGGEIIAWGDGRSTPDSTVSYSYQDIYAQNINQFGYLASSGTGITMTMSSSWNMISIPVTGKSDSLSDLFPTTTGEAFTYDGGYVGHATFSKGKSYWLKFPSDQQVIIVGQTINTDTVDVIKGWNMIGSISIPIPVKTVVSVPGGIVTSNFFGYGASGYSPSDSIIPGKGYWVRVNQSGELIFSMPSAQFPAGAIHIIPTDELPPPSPGATNSQHPTSRIPSEYLLRQNYPNPFNPATQMSYGLPRPAHVAITIINTLGQEVARLIDEEQEAGMHTVQFDGSNLTSGVYFYKLTAGSSFTEVKKMLLMK
jgi:hypothetical protein